MFTEPAIAPVPSPSAAGQARAASSEQGPRFWLGHKTYWACQIGGWGSGLLLGIWGELLKPDPEPEPSRRASLVIYVSTVMGLLISHVFRWVILHWRWKEQRLPALIPRVIAGSLVSGVALASITMPMEGWLWQKAGPGLISLVIVWLSLHFTAWAGIYFGYHYYVQLQETRMQKLKMDVSIKETALASLRSQVNPHFLFNGLNTLRDLIETDPAGARAVVTQMAKLFRASLSSGDRHLIPLPQEIETVEAYLLIEKTRFEERLPVRSFIDPATRDTLVPPFLLQTLAENAVKYGVSSGAEPGGIEYTASLAGDGSLVLTVSNHGRLGQPTSSTGLGLKMARERLALLFDGRASLTIEPAENGLIVARAVIPQTPPRLT
ncbi:MAG: histidine kinase [Verrucomicrobiota bacterium]